MPKRVAFYGRLQTFLPKLDNTALLVGQVVVVPDAGFNSVEQGLAVQAGKFFGIVSVVEVFLGQSDQRSPEKGSRIDPTAGLANTHRGGARGTGPFDHLAQGEMAH